MLIPLGLLFLAYVFYEKKHFRYTMVISFGLIILSMILFRYGVGTDYFAYKDIFYSMSKTDFTLTKIGYPTIEIGFILITLLARNLDISYQVYVSILSIIMFTSYMYFQRNYLNGKSLIISTSLYYSMFFLVWSLSAFRQGLALAVLLLTVFNYKLNLKFTSKLLIILLASTIHVSSLIVIPYLIVEKYFKSKKHIYALLALSTLVSTLIILITPHLLNIEYLNNITYISKILYYFENSSISYSSLIIRILILVYLLFFYDWFENSAKEIFYLYRMMIIGLAFYIVLMQAPIAASRMTIYSYIFLPVILAHSVEYFDSDIYAVTNVFSKQIMNLILLSIFSFNLLFLGKESRAFSAQTSYESNLISDGFPTVFEKKPEMFKNMFALNDLLRNKSDILYQEYYTEFTSTEEYEYKDGDSFLSVPIHIYSKTNIGKKYGIINQKGSLVIEPKFQTAPDIYGVLYGEYYEADNLSRYQYTPISPTFDAEIFEYINKQKSIQTIIELQDVLLLNSDMISSEAKNNIQTFLGNLGIEDFTIISKSVYSSPTDYSKVVLEIYKSKYTILLDKSSNVVSKTLYDSIGKYDHNGFIHSYTNKYVHIYNLNGDLIWVRM